MTISPAEPAPEDVPKLRCCLRCQTRFQSAWAGERICRACKGTQAWKSGESSRRVSGRGSQATRSSGGSG